MPWRAMGWVFVLAAWGCESGAPAGEEALDYGEGHARAELIAHPPFLSPGDTTWVGVAFDIEPGWHLYWNGVNDTGYPIQVSPRLPEGFHAGELLWPGPERYISPGGILDHVYHREVTLLFPLAAPASLPDSPITITCALEWLACREICLPGADTVSVTLPVAAAGTERSAEPDPRIRNARSRLPRALDAVTPEMTWHWEQNTAVVEAPGSQRLAFYPSSEGAPLANLLSTGEAEPGPLRLSLAPGAEAGAAAIDGVIAVWMQTERAPVFYTVSIPIPGP